MYKCFVCRYHEIATKGHNRSMFENKLINNIRTLAEYDGIKDITLQRIRGRIFLRKLKNRGGVRTVFGNEMPVTGAGFTVALVLMTASVKGVNSFMTKAFGL